MINSDYKNYNSEALQTMLETTIAEMNETKKLNCPGQTPEYWGLLESVTKIRSEIASREARNKDKSPASLF